MARGHRLKKVCACGRPLGKKKECKECQRNRRMRSPQTEKFLFQYMQTLGRSWRQ